ncbi:MAG TPA: sugar ABC transporter ATP-binding protein [Spirochaetales bacterium]|nr:sugar ABC transporter ATP-binding protein [Spirochaetales bacterium]
MAELLVMKDISKSFYGVSALKRVNFDLEKGEVHVLLGENGAGKSTLIKILSGAYRPDSGFIEFEGKSIDVYRLNPRAAEDLGIATIYQNFHLIPHLTVAENLMLPQFVRKGGMLINWKEVNLTAKRILDELEFDIALDAKVKDLSVSKKQMLEIAIALSKNAKILIMDEPTAALSQKEIELLFSIVGYIKERGIGIIFISHKIEEIKRIGDRVTVLRDGSSIATVNPKEVSADELISIMIGKTMSTRRTRLSVGVGKPVLSVRGLQNENFPEPISLEVREHEILGIAGVVGSGKTELARALFGIDPTDTAEISFNGKQTSIKSPRSAVTLGIGYLPEDRDVDGLCLNMSVKENMTLANLAQLRSISYNRVQETQSVQTMVNEIAVKTPSLGQQVKYLSGGNKQKVILGKWLLADCRLLLLDEPTIGIDVGARNEIYGLIRKFVMKPGCAVVFISSDIDEILEVSARILVMSQRTVVAELDPEKSSKNEILQYSLGVKRKQHEYE